MELELPDGEVVGMAVAPFVHDVAMYLGVWRFTYGSKRIRMYRVTKQLGQNL